MDPKSDSDFKYEEVDVIVPEHTPVTFEEINALLEKAMARMGVTITFEEFCIRTWRELEEHSKQ